MGCSRRFWPNQSTFFFRLFIENAEGWKMRFVHCREKKKLRVSSENPIWRQKGRSGRISEPRRRISLWKSNFWCSGGSEQVRNGQQEDAHLQNITKIIIWKVKRDQAWVERKGLDRGFVFSAVGEELSSVRGGPRAADGRRWIFDAIFPGPPPDVP